MKLFRLLFKFLKSSLGILIDRIFGVFANIEPRLELLRCANNALLETLQTHLGVPDGAILFCRCWAEVLGIDNSGDLDVFERMLGG